MNTRSRWIGLGMLILVVAGSFFLWRVFHYYRSIVSGTLAPEDIPSISFSDRLTRSSASGEAVSYSAVGSSLVTADDPSLGSPDAPVQVVEFADFACPYSAEVSAVVRRYAVEHPDQIHFIFRDFPLEEEHPGATFAAKAGVCAHAQGLFWPYHDVLFSHQTSLNEDRLIAYAEQVGLDDGAFADCLRDAATAREVEQDKADGQRAGVVGTPTFFFQGVKVEGAIPEIWFEHIVGAFL